MEHDEQERLFRPLVQEDVLLVYLPWDFDDVANISKSVNDVWVGALVEEVDVEPETFGDSCDKAQALLTGGDFLELGTAESYLCQLLLNVCG
jgi:hypothetical protein